VHPGQSPGRRSPVERPATVGRASWRPTSDPVGPGRASGDRRAVLLFVPGPLGAGSATRDEASPGCRLFVAHGLAALVVARRQPGNLVGWVLAGVVVRVGMSSVSLCYVESSDDPAG
jgi:hypothetical protein